VKRALIDLSSVIWTCLKAGEDTEHGIPVLDEAGTPVLKSNGKPKLANSAGYGYDNAMQHLIQVMKELQLQPHQFVFVREGMNSKQGRQSILGTYKAKRDKLSQEYLEFNKCKDMLLDLFLGLGSQVVWQDGVEADDVLGYLAKHLKSETWIVTGDKDLAQCIGGNVHLYRRGEKDTNPFGPFDVRWIAAWIAIVGDTADGIPGAKGFGEKAGEKLLVAFGNDGLEMLDGLIRSQSLGRLSEDVGEMKELQKLIDDASNVYKCYELGRLRTEHVNTLRNPLQYQAGMVKPRAQCPDNVMFKYAGQIRLVSAETYQESVDFLKKHLYSTPWFSLDIETSTPPESDEWLERQDKEDKVLDVFGSELTGLSITFGPNLQYTYYLTHEHVEEAGVTNLTLAQVRDMVDMIPREKITWVHNNAFEMPVLYSEWGQDWIEDPDYHGFLRNVRDTAIASSYVDENRRRGLKSLSSTLLGYEQQTFDEVTTVNYIKEVWDGKGKVLGEWYDQISTGEYEWSHRIDPDTGEEVKVQGNEITVNGDLMVKVQHKMNELTARHVLTYGADDAITTSALANHFQFVMEIEGTDDVFHEVETWPAYLTALGFVQGVDFSLAEMAEMEKEDTATYDKGWEVLRDYLMRKGFDGTVCPQYTELSPANIKEAHLIVTGRELSTMVRTHSKLAKLIEQQAEEYEDDDMGYALATQVAAESLAGVNALVAQHFVGEPRLDMASPKTMRKFLYETVGLPVQIVNDVTPTERQKQPELADAIYKHKRKRMGKATDAMTDRDFELLRRKAKTDDTAIDYALAFDADSINDDDKAALACVQKMKKVMTRRSLYYRNYWGVRHWKDGKIHSSVNQCAAVTRRYSMSNPNLQQLPKKGEAVRFRGFFKPHHRDAVICSIDFTGQELRLAAEVSQDRNMLACYIGDNLKDIHSITAASAMRLKWGDARVDELAVEFGASIQAIGLTKEEFEYRLFLKLRDLGKSHTMGKVADDLRKESKNVNFAAQFGGQAAKLSETLIMRIEDAQLFLDARSAMFPDVDRAAKMAAAFAEEFGYARTLMGARRHLRDSVMSDDKRIASGALRQAWNMEIQGSAGEMTKIGMGRLWKSGALFKYDVRFFAPIHDELVTSVHKDHAVEFLKIKHECMTGSYADMSVPILGSISLGTDFADQIECGDWFIEDRIKAAIEKCFKREAVAA